MLAECPTVNINVHCRNRSNVVWRIEDQSNETITDCTLLRLERPNGAIDIYLNRKQVKDLMATIAGFLAAKHYNDITGTRDGMVEKALIPTLGNHLDAFLHEIMATLAAERKAGV